MQRFYTHRQIKKEDRCWPPSEVGQLLEQAGQEPECWPDEMFDRPDDYLYDIVQGRWVRIEEVGQ